VVFVLAVFVGYHVIWNVYARAAHAADERHQRDLERDHRRRHPRRGTFRDRLRSALGAVAVALAAVNVAAAFS